MDWSLPPWLVDSVVAGSVAVLVVWGLRPLVRRWLGSGAAQALWLLVVVRTVCPMEVPIPVPWTLPWTEMTQRSGGAITGSVPERTWHVSVSVEEGAGTKMRAGAVPAGLWLWWCGAAGMALSLAWRIGRGRRWAREARDVSSDARIEVLMNEICAAGRRPRVMETDRLRSPALAGILHPVILLPSGWRSGLGNEDLRLVLLHEIGHWRRGDVGWQVAMEMVRVVQWFNPLMWLAVRSARRDQELACDEWVLQREGGEAARYGEAILNALEFVRTGRSSSPLHALMAESRAGLARRLKHLQTVRPRRPLAVVAGLGLAGVVVALIAAHGTKNPPKGGEVSKMDAAAEAAPEAVMSEDRMTQVEVETRVLEITPQAADKLLGEVRGGGRRVLSPEEYGKLIRRLGVAPAAVDLLSAPRVITRPGRKALVQVVREFRFPVEFHPTDRSYKDIVLPPVPTAFDSVNVGLVIEAEPEVLPGGRILCGIGASMVEFLGFIDFGADHAGTGGKTDALRELIESSNEARDGVKREDGRVEKLTMNQPVFERRKVNSMVMVKSGETVVLGGLRREDEKVVRVGRATGQDSLLERALNMNPQDSRALHSAGGEEKGGREWYVFVTLRTVDTKTPQGRDMDALMAWAKSRQAGKPTASGELAAPQSPGAGTPTPNASPQAMAGGRASLPYGTPVAGKPGFVTSPYAPKDGYVDLRGFPPGTEVKCPYTGKLFRAP